MIAEMKPKIPDWTLFSEILDNKVLCIKELESKNTDKLVEELTETIILVAHLTIGKTKGKNSKPKVTWWNENIKKTIKNKIDALKIFQKTNKQDDFIKL